MNRICKEYGHSWRFETANGRCIRTCENCGIKQVLLTFDDGDGCRAWGSLKEGSE